MNHLRRNLLQRYVHDPLRMSVVRYCDLLRCDDHVVALNSRELAYQMNELDALRALAYQMIVLACRMNELVALCDLPGVMCALAYQMNVLAYRMNVLDALCDLPGVMCALACRKNEQAYQMFALACQKNVLDVRCVLLDEQSARCVRSALVRDALGARCDLRQTSLHGSLALDGHPFQIRALMSSDVGCPFVRLRSPST
jgi:hypothetical protein